MAASSSGSPSSSAVTIPRPGKSILKRPPPPQQSFFLRITSKLVTAPNASQSAASGNGSQNNQQSNESQLKRAHFFLPHLTTVYPISTANPPSGPTTKDEKRSIETREMERRRKIVRGNSWSSGSGMVETEEEWWSMDRVEAFYNECCEGREEMPHPGVSAAFKRAAGTKPRSLDLSGVQITPGLAATLSDVFVVEWGLRKITLKECDLEEHTLKPLLHALLIPNSLNYLSVASNRLLKLNAFKIIGAFVEKAKTLQFLDLSQNPLDRKSIECIGNALGAANEGGLVSLRLDDCALKPMALEVLAHAVRTSSLRNISLRHNRITANGAVALALMIKDYPDAMVGGSFGTGSAPSTPTSATPTSSSTTLNSAGSGTYGPPRSPSLTSISSLGSGSTQSMQSSRQSMTAPSSPALGSLPLSAPATSGSTFHPPPASTTGSAHSSLSPSPSPTPLQQPSSASHHSSSTAALPPPPRHPSTLQTTYTPYIPRSKRFVAPPSSSSTSSPPSHPPPATSGLLSTMPRSAAAIIKSKSPPPLSASGEQVPIITSSARGGVTTRHPIPSFAAQSQSLGKSGAGRALNNISVHGHGVGHGSAHTHDDKRNSHIHAGPSAALLDKVRALDSLPRLGELKTLDLRGNDIRGGITYIAQVLKRNRTLKVLNLSENKIDVQGLVAVADALKYNSSLETLDLSKNPCGGPSLDGIQSLRTAFTLNTSLKRLFLSSTSLSSTAAIALAEFLPESVSLLHLDLTDNTLDLAGIMALSGGLKANHVMRCLDVNIPPADEEFARVCREILSTCTRNTEEAEKAVQTSGSGKGLGKGIWNMIEESELAKSIKKEDSGKTTPVRANADVITQAKEYQSRLNAKLSGSDAAASSPLSPSVRELESTESLIENARTLLPQLTELIQSPATAEDPAKLQELLVLNDSLTSLVSGVRSKDITPTPTGPVPNGIIVQSPSLESNIKDASENYFTLSTGTGTVSPTEAKLNGDAAVPSIITDVPGPLEHSASETESEEMTTPRIDKGKGRAEPEPEIPEKIISPPPRFIVAGIASDDEEHDPNGRILMTGEPEELEVLEGSITTDRSRSWVQEEGEVFRKSNVLLTEEEMEGEYAGDDLRKELLEAEVERRPRNYSDIDDYGGDYMSPTVVPLPTTPDGESPWSGSLPSSPVQELKNMVRPYVTRSRSSSSSVLSPSQQSFSTPGLTSPTATISEEGSSEQQQWSPLSPIPTSPVASIIAPLMGRRRSTSSLSENR